MTAGWGGIDPTAFDDGPGTTYELGAKQRSEGPLTLNAIRIWHGPASFALANRRAKIWNATGSALLREVTLPDSLPPGWSSYPLASSLELPTTTEYWVTYSTRQYYGATPGNFPVSSVDNLVTTTAGAFNNAVGLFPDNPTASFFGVDVDYSAGVAGNAPPSVALSAISSGLTGTLTIVPTDETPATVTYSIDWGDGSVTNTSAEVVQHTYASTGSYAIVVLATDAGGLVDAAGLVLLILGPDVSYELKVQRRATDAFIAARPTLVTLTPRLPVRSGTGTRLVDQAPRLAQVGRLIEVNATGGPDRGPDGAQRKDVFQLLLPFDGVVGKYDHFTLEGIRHEVTGILPFNGYEVRAEVTRYGETG